MIAIRKTLALVFSLIFGLFVTSPSVVKAQDPSVESARAVLVQLAKFSEKQAVQTEAAQRLLTDEMLGLKIPSFGKLTEVPDKVLLLEKNKAVGRFQRFGENDQLTDVYFYLQFKGEWKISAVRLLALTGIIEQAYLGLKAKPNLTEDESSLFANLRLTLLPDSELKLWFGENLAALNKLAALLQSTNKKATFYLKPDDKQFPVAADLLKKLNLSTAGVGENGNIEFVIGGVTDNTVGFLYSPSKNPPNISPGPYIWVEEVAARWYLFRTT